MSALKTKIKVIGCGAIGSFTVLSLAKMGFKDIEVWDKDAVSTENMNSQFYRFSDIGKPKVLALYDLVKDFTGVEIKANECFYTGGLLEGIVISAVDSMSARELIWSEQAGKSIHCKSVIDPRMGAESALMYVNNPMSLSDDTSYRKTLYSDSEGVDEPCTAKATMYTVNLIAGYVAKAVKDLCVDGKSIKNLMWSIKHNDLVVSCGT